MRLFGFEITRQKQLAPVDNRDRGWFGLIRESFPGAWQQNVEVRLDNVLSYHAVYACIIRIASDIAKLRLRLVEQDANRIWTETESPAFSPVLRKPNRYQNRIQFIEQWLISKLTHGNTYVLKVRDNRSIVTALYVLDPQLVKPLVAPDGSVFYELRRDYLSTVRENSIIVPAREIIHDRMNPIFHPLVGVSPIFASGLAAVQGLNIQKNSATFFGNGSRPGGVLTAPGSIADETAQRIKEHWEANFSGANAGKVAVLGDGLKYEQMTMTAEDAQLIAQLKWTAQVVCSVFQVPPYKIGAAEPPSYNNIGALNQQYYSECLQVQIEEIELALDEGLELPEPYGTEFDRDDLLQMDLPALVSYIKEGIGAGVLKPNEGRAKMGLGPVKGGDTPYMQQQNYSLHALDERDKLNPLATPGPNPGGTVDNPVPPDDEGTTDDDAGDARHLADELLSRAARYEREAA